MKNIFKVIDFFIGVLTAFVVAFIWGGLSYYSGYHHYSFIAGGSAGAQSLAWFMTVSVICTVGIALFIWIPGLSLVGLVVRKIFGFITGIKVAPSNPVAEILTKQQGFRPTEQVSTTEQVEPVSISIAGRSYIDSHSLAAVIGYISSAKATGVMNNEMIRTNLKGGGWSDEIIDNAFKSLTSIGL